MLKEADSYEEVYGSFAWDGENAERLGSARDVLTENPQGWRGVSRGMASPPAVVAQGGL